ncbi:uncharacterized protein LOC134725775 [Mytilus trossulus]|uniref:uncharacterized protein LOC134725775 n=1 Tax=Mytilus trossulus TaxID=6551 RepID=UPI003003C6EF
MSKIMKNHNLQTRKRGVMKDIEDWINEKHKREGESDFDDFMNRSSHKDSRMSGILPENVTEERLLRSRLFELGNERYKFLARFTFEKQQFQDKKVKRINAMKARVMSASSAPGRLGTSVSRQSMMSAKGDMRLRRFNDAEFYDTGERDLPSRARTVHFMPSQSRKPECRVLKASTPMGYHLTGSKLTKTNKFSKFGGAIPGLTNDPRYSFLEKSLSPAYVEGKNKRSVREIVKSIESLHKLPGNGIRKVDMGAKIQTFVKECKLSFSGVVKQQMIARRLVKKSSEITV